MIAEDSADSFFDIPTAPTKNLLPQKRKDKEVKPWHAPRKQWVRIYQWNAQIDALIAELQRLRFSPTTAISYLSLPGTELLDLRMVLQLCEAKNVKFKFLGFNDPQRESATDKSVLNISESELRQQPNVHQGSLIVKDKLEQLARKTSTAQVALEQFGSLDVINLDLTHCVANLAPGSLQQDYYKAIHRLFEHQRNSRVEPFLFFLTTRVHPGLIDRTAFGIFLDVLEKNFQQHASFAEKMRGVLGIEIEHISDAKNDLGFDSISSRLDKVFSVALSKWMLNLLLDGGPQWSIEMQDSCAYSVHAGHTDPDMFSYAFICRPIKRASVDRAGLSALAENQLEDPEGLELRFAKSIIDAVQQVFDLDRRLFDDQELTEEMIVAAKSLMQSANYPSESYEAAARVQLEKVATVLRERDEKQGLHIADDVGHLAAGIH